MWKQIVYLCFLLSFQSSIVTGDSGELKWFPNMMCHPGINKTEVDRLHYFAKKECSNLDKDDPCLKFCVFKSFYLFEDNFQFKCQRTWAAFKERLNIEDKLGSMDECRAIYGFPLTRSNKEEDRAAKEKHCRDPVFTCLDGFMNCNPKGRVLFGSKLFDFSYRPEYDQIQNLDGGFDKYCEVVFENNTVCQMACATHAKVYEPDLYLNAFVQAMEYHAEELETNSQFPSMAVKTMAENALPNFRAFRGDWSYREPREAKWNPVARELASKIIDNCYDVWKKTLHLNWEKCAEEQDQWVPLFECLDKIIKCKV